MYAVGARLDREPEKLFLLRGLDHNELLEVSSNSIDIIPDTKGAYIDDSMISDIFNIDILDSNKKKQNKSLKKTSSKFPEISNGNSIKRKRTFLKLTQREFGEKIGVSASTICKWEANKTKQITISKKNLQSLKNFWENYIFKKSI